MKLDCKFVGKDVTYNKFNRYFLSYHWCQALFYNID